MVTKFEEYSFCNNTFVLCRHVQSTVSWHVQPTVGTSATMTYNRQALLQIDDHVKSSGSLNRIHPKVCCNITEIRNNERRIGFKQRRKRGGEKEENRYFKMHDEH